MASNVVAAPARADGRVVRARRRRRAALPVVAAALAATSPALAVNYVWTNSTGDNNFNNPLNWTPAPGGPDDTNDAAIFDGTQPGSDTFTVNFTNNVLNDRVQLNIPGPGGTITFNLGGFTYTVDGGLFESVIVGQSASAPTGLLLTNGTVNAADGTIGQSAGSSGNIQVTAGGALNFSRFLRVGSSGNGGLQVRDGGNVFSASGITVGGATGTRGTIDVIGAGSVLREGLSLQVGNSGTGVVQVFSGGLIDAKDVIAGTQAGSTGTILVNGAGSLLKGKGVTIGLFGRGDFTVNSGGRVEHTERLDIGASQPGSLLVTGSGSSWTAGTLGVLSVDVGSSTTGSLTVDQGATFTNPGAFTIGTRAGATGNVLLAGSGSRLNTGNLFVGGSQFGPGGDGTLTLAGGILTVGFGGGGQTLKVFRTGTLNLNGTTVNTQTLDVGGKFDWAGGTLNVAGGASFLAGATGSGLNIAPGRTLAVTGNTTIDGVALTLDGGTFSTQSLSGGGALVLNSGTFTFGSPVTLGAGQRFGPSLRVGPGLSFNTTAGSTVQAGSVLALDGGSFSAAGGLSNAGEIQLSDDFSTLSGGALTNSGLLVGSGRVNTNLTNGSSGVIRASAGQRVSFRGTSNTNAGSIDLVGGTVEFTSALTNSATGEIHGRGTLVTGGFGLTNQGSVFLSSGITDVFGRVSNAAGGRVVVSGNADATFWDDVSNNGAQFKVADGSSATFFGTYSGEGISGTGKVFFEGTVSPGNSPGLLTLEGDVALGGDSVTRIELAGTVPGTEYDRLDVGGDMALAGTLRVELLDGFAPSSGDRFDLIDASSLKGQFRSLSLPALGPGLSWDTSVLSADGSISVVPEPSVALLVLGAGAVRMARRRRARA